ncbi:hypothetical protein BDP27DRAFT_464514 [Rhodocollybia butyracea]|uniref:Uncharacterized protein n=1 Tax=Rhodocollybia butyracea TaxID=206335 RepID=A0A9P5TZM1_9AGAR|nr:hypothetical protein BDP27DRAFT_464514 [Rhodocollybia butyracea]
MVESTIAVHRFDFGFLPIPLSCRIAPGESIAFGYARVLTFAFASTFTPSRS